MNSVESKRIAEIRRNTSTWLSQLDFSARHHELSSARTPGTGSWILESPTFRSWVDGEEELLICEGPPGSGKSMLASFIIDYLSALDPETTMVLYAYVEDKQRAHRPITEYIGSFLRQIYEKMGNQDENKEDEIVELFNRCHQSMAEENDLFRTLNSVISRFEHVYVVIDGCENLPIAFNELHYVPNDSRPTTKRLWFYTSPAPGMTHGDKPVPNINIADYNHQMDLIPKIELM